MLNADTDLVISQSGPFEMMALRVRYPVAGMEAAILHSVWKTTPLRQLPRCQHSESERVLTVACAGGSEKKLTLALRNALISVKN
jgi:hypothetical protein